MYWRLDWVLIFDDINDVMKQKLKSEIDSEHFIERQLWRFV